MRESLILHQTVEYHAGETFLIRNAGNGGANLPYGRNSHWHEELEIAYILQDKVTYYIEGEQIEGNPGRLVVAGCESVHRISVAGNENFDPNLPAVIVLLLSKSFLEENFPEYRSMSFPNERTDTRPEIKEIMLQCSAYRDRKERHADDHLFMRGLLCQLLYHLCEDGLAVRKETAPHADIRRLKQVLRFVEEHYREPITQADMAARLYFTPQYFSRYFKRFTGMTFTEHLTLYRLSRAKKELAHTDKAIGEIALDNGFADDRGLINAFKKNYQQTPSQYRKRKLMELSQI